MKEEIELDATQLEAIEFLINSVKNNEQVIGLTGAGGTGKSEIISRFKPMYLSDKENIKTITYSATTNKAVSRLRKETPEAKTLHSAVCKPNYTRLYNELESYYTDLPEDELKRDEYNEECSFSRIFTDFFSTNNIKHTDFESTLDVIFKLGMSVFDEPFFEGYIVKDEEPNSIIIIDESSMLPTNSYKKDGSLITIGLETVVKVFSNVILVGDSNQLPPINGSSSFEGIETYELTKNFRSEKDLLDAIQWARDGNNFHNYKNAHGNVRIVNSISDSWYDKTFGKKDVVHLCYTNKTRHEIIKKIRKGKPSKPLNGEPVIYRGANKTNLCKGELGFYNKGSVEFEDNDYKLNRWSFFDEYEKDKYSIFQFGYASTAHMYQGSEANHVIIHLYDIPYFIDDNSKRKWIYTAISRAKKSITIIL